MKRVAIIGTQGVPAAYGGFETLVENLLGDNCPADIQYTVFCSSREQSSRPLQYKGARLRYIPLSSHGIQSIPYDILSMMLASRGYDVLLVLGTSGCSFLPALRLFCRKRLVVNIDGIEHRRDKWSPLARRVLLFSERMALKHADAIVADNAGIVDYVKATYGVTPHNIAYGADHANVDVDDEFAGGVLKRYGVQAGSYGISVCRVEPENNPGLILEAFAQHGAPLLFIGNWAHSEYGLSLKRKYASVANIHICDPEYDLATLSALRTNARWYLHGHSAGGTNPSLVEAMTAGRPILAYDVVYNRATTFDSAYYFADVPQLIALLHRSDLDGTPMQHLASTHYTWPLIASKYLQLF